MSFYYVNTPTTGTRQVINYTPEDNKIDVLNESVLDFWSDYCNSHWLFEGTTDIHKTNHEDDVKRFLDRCADFLLEGHRSDADINTRHKELSIMANELSLSVLDDDVDIQDEMNDYIKSYFRNDGKMLETKFNNTRRMKKEKPKTQLRKFDEIYGCEDVNGTEYFEKHVSNSFSVWDYKNVTTEGLKGMIDSNKPYTSAWCIIDKDNIFEFDNNEYKISSDVEQYKKTKRHPRWDDYKNIYRFDKIYCVKQDEKTLFFDQNVDILGENDVKLVKNSK